MSISGDAEMKSKQELKFICSCCLRYATFQYSIQILKCLSLLLLLKPLHVKGRIFLPLCHRPHITLTRKLYVYGQLK